MIGKFCIVRSINAGVFAGTLTEESGQTVILENAIRIWYWEGAASLSQLAMEGTSQPTKCKFPCAVDSVKLFEVIEIIPCREVAETNIKAVPTWEC